MPSFMYNDVTYTVDADGFLCDAREWSEGFAEGMARKTGLGRGLTKDHWDVIRLIRKIFEDTGKCPLVYQTCRLSGLHLDDLRRLFPEGYLRGACKLAGLTYRDGFLGHAWHKASLQDVSATLEDQVYRIDGRGFLVDPSEWDEVFAINKAFEMKIPGNLTEKHWRIIRFLRRSYTSDHVVPNVYATCEANGMDLEELETLFPDGYHRGAVKIAGLRAR